MREISDLRNSTVILGFSGGPDAAALAHVLRLSGASVVPVYVNYRKTAGGKTTKDLRFAHACAGMLGLPEPIEIRAPLGNRPKSHRNRFFVKVLASVARDHDSDTVALGTIRHAVADRATRNDLDPQVLARHGEKYGVRVITWDTLDVNDKAQQFEGMDKWTRQAIFRTTSCQMWWQLECGNCKSCVSRHRAFMESFGYDPTPYRVDSRIGRER